MKTSLISAEEHKQKYQLFNDPMQSKKCSACKKDQIALLYKIRLKNDNKKVTYIMHNMSLFFWGYNRCNSAIICGQLNRHGREIYFTTSCCTLGEIKQCQKTAFTAILLTQHCTSDEEKY